MTMIKKIFLSVLLCTVCMFGMAQSQTVTHVVQRGETLESIAEYYKVSVEDINKANPNADGIVYVGMKLVVPVGTTNAKTTTTVQQGTVEKVKPQQSTYESTAKVERNYNNASSNTWQRNQTRVLWGLTYFAQDFDDVKLSGHYGLTIDALNIGGSLFGFNATVFSFNWGLVDKDYTTDLILFGPNVAYEFAQNFIVALPVQAMCNVSFDDKGDQKTWWGWAISPRLYYSFGKVNINAGILINGGFKKGEKATCGFTAGIGFDV